MILVNLFIIIIWLIFLCLYINIYSIINTIKYENNIIVIIYIFSILTSIKLIYITFIITFIII